MTAALRWIYDWITVIAAMLVGLPELLLAILNAVEGLDIVAFVGPERALTIITTIAVAKAVLAFIQSRLEE
jgi:hypothetical protein